MIKWTNSWNSSTYIMMRIFRILLSRLFRFYLWSLLPQKLIQSLPCCFINIEEKILLSQISCYKFLCSSQSMTLRHWLMETVDITKELVLFYVVFVTVTLYIRWDALVFSRSPFQHHIIRCPKKSCFFLVR